MFHIFYGNLKERVNKEMNALCITFTNPVISFTKKGACNIPKKRRRRKEQKKK